MAIWNFNVFLGNNFYVITKEIKPFCLFPEVVKLNNFADSPTGD